MKCNHVDIISWCNYCAMKLRKQKAKEGVTVTGAWLRRSGPFAEMLLEVNGQWLVVAQCGIDGNFGHIVEPSGILSSPHDYIGKAKP